MSHLMSETPSRMQQQNCQKWCLVEQSHLRVFETDRSKIFVVDAIALICFVSCAYRLLDFLAV
jgi:hypothetical protein